MQKHYALSAVDSIDQFFTYCTYSTNENPLNELSPSRTSFTPLVSTGNTSSPWYHPFVSNQAWTNEPFCVEMLGGLNESDINYGPNPCNEFIQFTNLPNTAFTLSNSMGQVLISNNDPGSQLENHQALSYRLRRSIDSTPENRKATVLNNLPDSGMYLTAILFSTEDRIALEAYLFEIRTSLFL